MKFILSRYNHDMSWMNDYDAEYFIYDRSETPMEGANVVPNIGTDIYDKFTYIIDHYDNLPDVAIYTKANIFKYISKEEFDQIKDNQTFTPIMSKNHTEVMCDEGLLKYYGVDTKPFSYYDNGMYYELNFPSYIKTHPMKGQPVPPTLEFYQNHPLTKLLGLDKLEYVPFAPGSNYILPKENILKHSKEHYQKLRSYLEWDRYPGESMVLERGLYTLWS